MREEEEKEGDGSAAPAGAALTRTARTLAASAASSVRLRRAAVGPRLLDAHLAVAGVGLRESQAGHPSDAHGVPRTPARPSDRDERKGGHFLRLVLPHRRHAARGIRKCQG